MSRTSVMPEVMTRSPGATSSSIAVVFQVVGLAIGGGTDVAIESAGIILINSNPLDVVKTIRLSYATYRKMVQNLWWAAGYNLISVPLAAGVLAPIGFILPMSVGAVLMSLSTVVVALNAQSLRRLDLRPEVVVRD